MDLDRDKKSVLELYQLAIEKTAIDKSPYDAREYFEGIQDEIREVGEQFHASNAVLLEDEVGDILWDYFCMVAHLEREGLIRSSEHVFMHAREKYGERFEGVGLGTEGVWDAIKKRQKERLFADHEAYQKSLEKNQ